MIISSNIIDLNNDFSRGCGVLLRSAYDAYYANQNYHVPSIQQRQPGWPVGKVLPTKMGGWNIFA